MTRFWISLSIGVAAFSLLLAAPAEALNLVSWVSWPTGNNSNDCITPATPCRDIEGALPKTETGGEIKCLANHFNGSVVVDKPVTIDCGAPGTIIAKGFSGDDDVITVNINEASVPDGVVTLRNLTIHGMLGTLASLPGRVGIRVIGGGGAVHIENVTIEGFTDQGIEFVPTSSGVDLFVRDSVITVAYGGGLLIKPTGSAKVVLENVNVDDNAWGVHADGRTASGALNVTVRDSVISGNTAFGIRADESGAGTTNVMLESSTSSNNGTNGVVAVGSNAVIRMRNSTSTGNTASGLVALSGGQIVSHGGNVVAGNTTNGAFTGTFAQQ